MHKLKISIRKAIPKDIHDLVAFQQRMANETEGKELNQALLLEGVRTVLLSPTKGYYLVAEADGIIVAGLLVTFEWSDWRNATFLWIQSVYVDSGYRRKGIYRMLHEYVMAFAWERTDICGLRLYVDRDNVNAQKTYSSLGMAKSHYDMYEIDLVL